MTNVDLIQAIEIVNVHNRDGRKPLVKIAVCDVCKNKHARLVQEHVGRTIACSAECAKELRRRRQRK